LHGDSADAFPAARSVEADAAAPMAAVNSLRKLRRFFMMFVLDVSALKKPHSRELALGHSW